MRGVISVQSHVVYGHAGNSAAVFPLQKMGIEVWPIHTVQYSNHTQYQNGWTGRAFTASEIRDIVSGLEALGAISKLDGVVTGYLASTGQGKVVSELVDMMRASNSSSLYVCDPVMGDANKGCIVPEEITSYLTQKLMPKADIIVPNQFELTQFTGIQIHHLNDAVSACKRALELGPKIVLVKHLHSLSDKYFTMMLAYGDECYISQRPHLNFERAPVGVGDLISALFTGGVLMGKSTLEAFHHTSEAVYGILKQTHNRKEWELQIIAAQDEIITPSEPIPVGKCLADNSWHYYSA